MTQYIRKLNKNDYSLVNKIQTGIRDDYVLRVFSNLLDRGDMIYGLFLQNEIICIGGFSIISDQYAMLGRLRSDNRFRGSGYASVLMNHIISEAFKHPHVKWTGANTEEDNYPTRRVLEKIGMTPVTGLFGAVTSKTEKLESGSQRWTHIKDAQQKMAWIQQEFIDRGSVFPYECYYPLPATSALFTPDTLAEWTCFENEDQTRMVLSKPDRKKHQYLHVVYPWTDIAEQTGLWETINNEYQTLKFNTYDHETFIWIDLTKKQADLLPDDHPFTLKSPWILHGLTRNEWELLHDDVHTNQSHG